MEIERKLYITFYSFMVGASSWAYGISFPLAFIIGLLIFCAANLMYLTE